MKICVFGASSSRIDKLYTDAAYQLGAEIARRGHTLYFGGGAQGLMGASARGASSQGGIIIGVAPRLFDADGVLYDGCADMIFTDTLAERKDIMLRDSDAFVALPGGIGTLDELFEVLTLRQLGVTSKPSAILNTGGYFDKLLDFLSSAIDEGFMIKNAAVLFPAFDDPASLLDHIEKQVGSTSPQFYK